VLGKASLDKVNDNTFRSDVGICDQITITLDGDCAPTGVTFGNHPTGPLCGLYSGL
jgi:hypothetical protein